MFEDADMESDWQSLIQLLLQAQDTELMEKLLRLFLTINEREYLVDRYRIIQGLLTSKLTQREIAEQFHVSIAKITAGSNELKRTSSDLKQFLEEFMSQQNRFKNAEGDP